ncbi:vezatin-like [Liolophura sinensis]|uniref:vezatin-like n=1 Tax=Liolophura sinensis TaxID=3198878 RepID=UPI00315883D7
MSQDSDEDVIFENSALHQHLKSAGVEDVKTETYQTQQLRENEALTEAFGKNCSKIDKNWKMLISDWFGFLHLKTTLRHLETVARSKIYYELRQGTTLEPDDASFLEEFLGPCFETQSDACRKVAGLLGFAVVIVAVLCQRIMTTNLTLKHVFYSDPLVVMATCCLMLLIGCYLFLFIKQKRLEEQITVFVEFLKTLEQFQLLLKKSIRLIQESELVARGFTLIANTGPLHGMEQRSGRSAARQCPELRHSVFHASRDSMMYIRNATRRLLQTLYPLYPESGTSHYLAFMDLEDFGPCVHVTGNSEESRAQLLEATDSFSVAALKGMSNLWILQQSEFIRCLAICFQSLSQWPATKAQSLSIHRLLHEVMKTPVSMLEDSLTTLQRCYDFHYASTVVDNTSEPVPDRAGNSQLKGLYVAIHSLDLHLQSALKISQSLASDIQKQIDNSDAEPSDEPNNEWMQKLLRIKTELAACHDCMSEGQSQGDRLFRRQPESAEGETHGKVSLSMKKQPATKATVQILGEPVIEDEVFETYVDDEAEDMQASAWDEFLSPEEKAKKKKEKEEAVRLLSELRTVISGLAEERKKKEERILLAKYGFVQSECHSGDNVQSVSLESRVDVQSTPGTVSAGVNIQSDNVKEESLMNSGQNLPKVTIKPAAEEDELSPLSVKPPALLQDLPVSSGSTETFVDAGEQASVSSRLERLAGPNLSFTASLAAQAVAKYRLLGLESQTFGDDNDIYGDSENDSDSFEDSKTSK